MQTTTLPYGRRNTAREQGDTPERYRPRPEQIKEECDSCGEICTCKRGLCTPCRQRADFLNRYLNANGQQPTSWN